MKALGVLVPMITPCTTHGEVDIEGAQGVCQDLLAAGCSAFFVAGSTGRGPWLTLAERVRLCQAVKQVLPAHIPLFAGCMASGLPEMLTHANALAEAGAHYAVVTAPFYFCYNHREVETIFSRFAEMSPLPVMLYDIPDFAGMKLDPSMVVRLAQHENVIGFKDSSADGGRVRQFVEAFRSMPDFYFVQGKENLLADSLRAGASGFVVSLVHMAPRLFVSLYHAAHAQEWERAQRLQQPVTAIYNLVIDCLHQRPETSTLFYLLSRALHRRGLRYNCLLGHEVERYAWVDDVLDRIFAIADEAECDVAASLEQVSSE